MTPEQSDLLDALERFVTDYQRPGKTRRQFWDAFHQRAGDLDGLAFAEDANEDLQNRYFEILDYAHEAYGGPEESLDEVME